MNRKMIAFFVGRVLRIEAALMILPTVVSLIYREEEWIMIAAAAICSVFESPKICRFTPAKG